MKRKLRKSALYTRAIVVAGTSYEFTLRRYVHPDVSRAVVESYWEGSEHPYPLFFVLGLWHKVKVDLFPEMALLPPDRPEFETYSSTQEWSMEKIFELADRLGYLKEAADKAASMRFYHDFICNMPSRNNLKLLTLETRLMVFKRFSGEHEISKEEIEKAMKANIELHDLKPEDSPMQTPAGWRRQVNYYYKEQVIAFGDACYGV